MCKHLFIAGMVIFLFGSVALADWDVGDPHKMHFPQLPDPDGWDVYSEYPQVLADDWMCSQTGPVTDVHVWGSWKSDTVGTINNIHVSIHSDDRSGPFSKPGDLLWERDFGVLEFTKRIYGTGDQGWYDPGTGNYNLHDHDNIWQYNIEEIQDPFIQQEGLIYWLDISVNFQGCQWGWKTSMDHFEDDAVWGTFPDPQWQELIDPVSGVSMDMAFVITPEPAGLSLLAIGALSLLRRKRN